ncbi:hypothetical protein JCM6882_005085 [Rhodosporidiobolus microsporus]
MLVPALSNRLSSGSASTHAPLIVLSDTLLQPVLLLAREFVHSALSPSAPSSQRAGAAKAAAQGQHVVLLLAEQPVHKLLPPRGGYDPARVTVLDCSLPSSTYAPVASTSTAPSPFYSPLSVDLSAPSAAKDLERLALQAVDKAGGEEVLVVVDSANALAEKLEGGVAGVGRVVKGVLKGLKGRKGSRLLIIHHDDLPSPPPSSSLSHPLIQPSLLRLLLSPTLSPSTLHLSLRPSPHLELLSREYGLAVPLPSLSLNSSGGGEEDEEEEPDLRLGQFLHSLANRAVGDPFVRPRAAGEEDERVRLDGLGAGVGRLVASHSRGGAEGRPRSLGLRAGAGEGGGCVVEWAARGVEVAPAPSSSSSSASGGGTGAGARNSKSSAFLAREKERERAARGEVKKVVKWGFSGVRAVARSDPEGGGGAGGGGGGVDVGVRECRVADVVERGRIGARGRAGEGGKLSPLPTPPSHPSSSAPPSTSSTTPSAPPPALPFSLTLTPSQLAARSLVLNPFLGADKPIYGEEGYVAPSLPGQGALASLGGAGGGAGGAGRVEYTPDEGDDLDEEDPDEDLEI